MADNRPVGPQLAISMYQHTAIFKKWGGCEGHIGLTTRCPGFKTDETPPIAARVLGESWDGKQSFLRQAFHEIVPSIRSNRRALQTVEVDEQKKTAFEE